MAFPTPALALLAFLAMLTPAAASPLEPLARTPDRDALAYFQSQEFLDAALDYVEEFDSDDLPGQTERTVSFIEDLLNKAPGFACVVGFSGQPITDGIPPLPSSWSIPGTFVDVQVGFDATVNVFGVGPVMTPANIPIPGIGYWEVSTSKSGNSECLPLTGLKPIVQLS